MALTLNDIDRNPGPEQRIPNVSEVEVIGQYQLRVTFDDGLVRELDLTGDTSLGGVFEPLKDPDFFARVRVDEGTIAWPNEVDYSPSALHGDVEFFHDPQPRLIREYVREEARNPKYDSRLMWAIRTWLSGWSWALRWRLRELRQRRPA